MSWKLQWFLHQFCFSLQSHNQGSRGRRKTFPGISSSTLVVRLNPQFLFWLPLPPALTFYTFTPLHTCSAKACTSLPAFLKCSCDLETTELFLSEPEPAMHRACRQLTQRLCLPGKVSDLISSAAPSLPSSLPSLTHPRSSISSPTEQAWDGCPPNSHPEPCVLSFLLQCDKQHPHTSCLINRL